MEDITLSKYHKKQLMDLGFRHSEAKCLLQCMNRVHIFKPYLCNKIDELTIFCMYDEIYATRCYIMKPKGYKYKIYYLPLFHMVSHKTKKILKTWLINQGHIYTPSKGFFCRCYLCNMFHNLKKLSEYEIDYYRERIINLPDNYISRIMYLFFQMKKTLNFDDEYILYLIIFEIEQFDKDITNIFTYDHKTNFYRNIKEFINTSEKLKVFDSLAINNYYLPPELLTNIHKFVLRF